MHEVEVRNAEINKLSKKRIKLINLLSKVDLEKLTPTEIRFMNARIDAFLSVSIFETE